jgi:hypothetical protein
MDKQQLELQTERSVVALADLFMAHYRLLKEGDLNSEQMNYVQSRLREIQAEIVKLVGENESLSRLKGINDFDNEETITQTVKPKKPFKWGRK